MEAMVIYNIVSFLDKITRKISKEKCYIHYSSVKEKNLITLTEKSSWGTLLAAAQIRGHAELPSQVS